MTSINVRPAFGKCLTGVGAVLEAAHSDKKTGMMHGHTWEIEAWVASGRDALGHQARLEHILARYDHGTLPAELAWGEAIAFWVAEELIKSGAIVEQVDVSRPARRLFARWINA